MLLYRVQVYIRFVGIRDQMSQVKISQEDKTVIGSQELHNCALSKQNIPVISVAPVNCAEISGSVRQWFIHRTVSQPTLVIVLLQ
jgi:hypothetical protein